MKEMRKSKIVYMEKCPECQKAIIGNSESALEYNLKVHIKSKHKNAKSNPRQEV